ncbi:SET domain-containing protein, partial [Armillaria gallica]
PIFECHEGCLCNDKCWNHVSSCPSHFHMEFIQETNQAQGIFLTDSKTVARGTFIGIYAGQYITKAEGYCRMASTGGSYLFNLNFHHLQGIHPGYMIDGERMGNYNLLQNHSCEANCCVEACYINKGNPAKLLIAIFANKDINPNDELTLSYFG